MTELERSQATRTGSRYAETITGPAESRYGARDAYYSPILSFDARSQGFEMMKAKLLPANARTTTSKRMT